MNLSDVGVGLLVQLREHDVKLRDDLYLIVAVHPPNVRVEYNGRFRTVHHTRIVDPIGSGRSLPGSQFTEHWVKRNKSLNMSCHFLVAARTYVFFSVTEKTDLAPFKALLTDPKGKAPGATAYKIRGTDHLTRLHAKWRTKGYVLTDVRL